MTERLQLRITGEPDKPTLIYFPGLHGDWTLVGGFRRALNHRVRFVEITYPRTLTWSLDDYAAHIENALAERGIEHGWLLGESFGSQVVWPIMGRRRFQADGVILAGGFVRHPARWAVRLAQRVCGRVSLRMVTRILFGYAKIGRVRFRNSPETLAGIEEFIARRTELDLQAATHRLSLIAQNDPCRIVSHANVPVYAITGVLDPIVPWLWVRRWLRKNCASLREYRIVRADHTVLATAPKAAAEQIVQWLNASATPAPAR
jgi:pimeloyl-ACP methyl ester carboxylesterase